MTYILYQYLANMIELLALIIGDYGVNIVYYEKHVNKQTYSVILATIDFF